MHDERNIFEGIVKKEDDFTQLLCNMCRYQVFRQAFADWLRKELNTEDFTFERDDINTQVHSKQHGRPDCVIDTGQVRIVIEVKATPDCGLTDNQPGGYLQDLRTFATENGNYKYCGLVCLVPRGYKHVSEIKCEDKKWRCKEKETKVAETSILYWDDLFHYLNEQGFSECNAVFHDFIRHLKSRFTNLGVTLSGKDIEALEAPNIREAIGNIIELVDTVQKCVKAGGGEVSPLKSHFFDDYSCWDYSFYRKENGKRTGYFGFSTCHWEHEKYVLLVGVSTEHRDRCKKCNELKDLSEDEGITYFGIKQSFFKDNDTDALTKICSLLTEVWDCKPIKGDGSTDITSSLDILYKQPVFSAFNEIVKAFRQVKNSVDGNITFSASQYEYSIRVKQNGTEKVWLSIYWDKDNGENALWVGVPSKTYLNEQKIQKWIITEKIKQEEWWWAPIQIQALCNANKQKDKDIVAPLVTIVETLCEDIQ